MRNFSQYADPLAKHPPIKYNKEEEEEETNPLEHEDIDDSNARKFFRNSGFNEDYVKFSNGKVFLKSYGFLDQVGYMLFVGGVLLVAVCFRVSKEGANKEFDIELFLIGLLMGIIGFVVTFIVKSYAVYDYRNKCIYTETHLVGLKIWQTLSLKIDEICAVSTDSRTATASPQNLASIAYSRIKLGSKTLTTESAVAALLKNGKIYYITGFTTNDELKRIFRMFSKDLSVAIKTKYKPNANGYKLIVQKEGGNYSLDSEIISDSPIGDKNIFVAFFDILLAVFLIVGGLVLVIYLMYKLTW